jgi:hypothetical protein
MAEARAAVRMSDEALSGASSRVTSNMMAQREAPVTVPLPVWFNQNVVANGLDAWLRIEIRARWRA